MHFSAPALIAAALALVVCSTAHATTYTTNKYYARSSNADIADSCKSFWVASGTGVISAECNSATSDDHISAISTTYDIDNAVYCPEKLDGTQTVIAWGTQSSSDVYVPKTWQIGLSTNGSDYILSAVCDHTGSGTTQDRSKLDLGDTTNGLKNNSGALQKR